jgi:hypothetical protein
MHGTLPNALAAQRNIQRAIVQGDARLCRPAFGLFCKAYWPVKTAENLAAAIGCSVRSAAYQISGEHQVSGAAIAWVVNLLVHGDK